MHPELRLIEDFLTDRGALSLPALPRMLYVVRGTITIGQRVLGQGEALICRFLGASVERARTFFEACWATIRPAVLGRPASRPRIWAT